MNKMVDSGSVVIWPDFDHVVPDWKSILSLGFSGILGRVKEYKSLHEQNGTLDENKRGIFDGIVTLYEAILRIIDRFYALAAAKADEKSEKLPLIAECLKTYVTVRPRILRSHAGYVYLLYGFGVLRLVSGAFARKRARRLAFPIL